MFTTKNLLQLLNAMQGAADYIDCIYEEDHDANRAAKLYSDRLKKQIEWLWENHGAWGRYDNVNV